MVMNLSGHLKLVTLVQIDWKHKALVHILYFCAVVNLFCQTMLETKYLQYPTLSMLTKISHYCTPSNVQLTN